MIITSLPEFFAASTEFVTAFDAWCATYSPAATADHICYKCGSAEEFESMRKLFETESAFIYQSIISKRRIAIVRFTTPIATALGEIWFLELSDQKPDGSQTSGFDHIEIYPKAGSMEGLAASLEALGASFEKVARPHHTTFDGFIMGDFKVRLEPEALVEKIKREEML